MLPIVSYALWWGYITTQNYDPHWQLNVEFTPAEFVNEFVFPRPFGKSLPIWAFNLLKMHLNSVSRDKKISRRFQSTRNGGQCPHFNILCIQKKIEKLKIFTRKYTLENLSKTKLVSIAEIRAKVRHDSLCIVLLNSLKITQRVRDMTFGWRKEIKD